MKKPRIVFFWRGPSIEIPEMLVKSIRLIYQDECRIIQISCPKTEKIRDVDECFRDNFNENIMLARLEGYSIVPLTDSFTYYCDADSLVIDKLALEDECEDHNVILNRRFEDGKINPNFPEHYPEFVNKNISEVMPFLFGGIAVRRESKFFPELLEICRSLPERFWRWYGDQVSLKLLVERNPQNYACFGDNSYLTILRTSLMSEQLLQLRQTGSKVVTFKGPRAKSFIKPTLEGLIGIYRT